MFQDEGNFQEIKIIVSRHFLIHFCDIHFGLNHPGSQLFDYHTLVCRYTIWPGGIRPSQTDRDEGWEGDGEGEGGEGVQMLRSVLARAKLIGSVPDDLRRLLGARRTTHGMGRCLHDP